MQPETSLTACRNPSGNLSPIKSALQISPREPTLSPPTAKLGSHPQSARIHALRHFAPALGADDVGVLAREQRHGESLVRTMSRDYVYLGHLDDAESMSCPAGSRTITKRTHTALLAEAPTMPNKRNSPDAVCARYAEKRTSLRLRMLDAETVLLQANEAGFRMLAELCASMASFSDPGFQMGPRSAGSRLFAKTSAFGIYLHRVEPKVAARPPQRRAPRPRTAKQARVGRAVRIHGLQACLSRSLQM